MSDGKSGVAHGNDFSTSEHERSDSQKSRSRISTSSHDRSYLKSTQAVERPEMGEERGKKEVMKSTERKELDGTLAAQACSQEDYSSLKTHTFICRSAFLRLIFSLLTPLKLF